MSESRIVVETPCEHGEFQPHPYPGKRISDLPYCAGGSRRIIDPGSLPAEVVEETARAIWELNPRHGLYDHRSENEKERIHRPEARKVLSAAFRTLAT